MVGTGVQSFIQLSGGISHALKQRAHNLSSSTRVLTGHKEDDANNSASLRYGIGEVDLSDRWVELVSGGHVTATTELNEEDDNEGLRVRYGVRSKRQGNHQHQPRLLEFVEMLSSEDDEQSNSKVRERIVFINETLSNMQQLGSIDEAGDEESLQNNNGLAIQCIYEGPYAAQLQLVRTLRPPRSQEMSSKDNEQAACQCPPYDASKDSFLVGSLRLFGRGKFHGEGEPRERAARVYVPRYDKDGESVSSTLPWDVYHNISPVDPRGHFLLLPAIDDKREWRDQSLTKSDCYDVTNLASAIAPAGSLCLSFNSVGAGASQNHIHCHAWACPPPPLLATDSGYAVEKALPTSLLTLEHGITVSLLDYPSTCIKLASPDVARSTLKKLGDALYRIVQMAQEMNVPHNVAWMNSPEGVDVYVFIRRAETSSVVEAGIFRLGTSEMLGVFHSSSREQLDALAGNMKSVLADVSWEPRQSLWEEIRRALE